MLYSGLGLSYFQYETLLCHSGEKWGDLSRVTRLRSTEFILGGNPLLRPFRPANHAEWGPLQNAPPTSGQIAVERKWNNLRKKYKTFKLNMAKAKASIWPGLIYSCFARHARQRQRPLETRKVRIVNVGLLDLY